MDVGGALVSDEADVSSAGVRPPDAAFWAGQDATSACQEVLG